MPHLPGCASIPSMEMDWNKLTLGFALLLVLACYVFLPEKWIGISWYKDAELLHPINN